ncbi:MAG: sensor histidine kinase [Paenibacillaceae bacterium]|nr:sensor histidine kinase [Paenibacillaceae bacterium]
MFERIRNMKWRLPLYFLFAMALTFAALVAGVYFFSQQEIPELAIVLIVAIVLIGPSVGYYVGQKLQNRIDELQLAVKQVAKGNLSVRVPVNGKDSIDALSADFNDMIESLESRIKLLHTLGEENVLLTRQSNEAAVLEERKRLARDLHDTVSQQLFAMHMSASSLPKLLESRPEVVGTVVEQLVSMSHHAQKQMRSLIAQLRPLELEGQSLVPAIERWFPDYCRQNGLQGKLDFHVPDELSEAVEHQLFLIIQEGMANVVKHARALTVSLSLADTGHQYALAIVDDGVGFDMKDESRRSYGLSTMRERAQRLGGDAEVLSRKGAGTSVKVRIPKFKQADE